MFWDELTRLPLEEAGRRLRTFSGEARPVSSRYVAAAATAERGGLSVTAGPDGDEDRDEDGDGDFDDDLDAFDDSAADLDSSGMLMFELEM